MPDNNQYNYRGQGGGQRRPSDPNARRNSPYAAGGRPQGRPPYAQQGRPPYAQQGRPVNRNPNQRPSNNRNNRKKRKNESSSAIGAAVKGIIAILITLLIVIIVIMVFAKNLFSASETTTKKTGSVTSTVYVPPKETKTATEKATTKKTAHGKKDKDEEEDEDESENVQTITCTGPVYLHPEPSSSSANLLTVPSGAEVKFYRNENGWYYISYDGKEGYAWGNYFTAPAETE